MIRPCKGGLDLFTGHISKQRYQYFKHVVFDQDTRGPYMHSNTEGEAGTGNRDLGDNGGGE